MGEDLPNTLYLQMDNCWRENKNQFVLNFVALLVKLDIFVKVNLIVHHIILMNEILIKVQLND